jgi:hypothetical protein
MIRLIPDARPLITFTQLLMAVITIGAMFGLHALYATQRNATR